jgi:membrane-associated phospholipid phosphatase
MAPKCRAWFVGLLLTGLLSFISITWIDRPIAILVHDLIGPGHVSSEVASSPGLSILSIPLFSALVFVIFGLLALLGRSLSRIEWAIVLCDISILAADTIKNQLKYFFGRTWPDSWGPHIVSFIHDNVYEFNFFHAGQSYESFPSGHAAVVAAAMTVLWIFFPRLRLAYALCMIATDVGLVLLNFHFVSDVIAGTFVGVSAGLFIVALCDSGLPVKPRGM